MPLETRAPSDNPRPLAVLGAGSWGTTIAWLLANNSRPVRLWARDAKLASEIQSSRRNRGYLPGTYLPDEVEVTADLSAAVLDDAYVFAVVPAKAVAELFELVAALPGRPAGVVSCIKGLTYLDRARPDQHGPGLLRQSERIAAALTGLPVAALSGPNLAGEIAGGKPAATTVASADAEFARELQALLGQPTFRVYTSSDIVGVELAGALKNVIAIAAGICDGLSLGDNAKSTIITRGLAELVRLGSRLGGQERTFYGLAGVGDVVATCMSENSRNHRAGVLLAQGEPLDSRGLGALTAEGLPTVAAVHDFAVAQNLELPITTEVYRVAYEGKAPHDAMFDLMTREGKAE